MDIHEYQAKELLASSASPSRAAASPTAPSRRPTAPTRSAATLGGQGADPLRRARQGRRHQALPRRPRDREAADELLGKRLVTEPDRPARQAGLAPLHRGGERHRRELYLGFVLDRDAERIMVVASAAAAWRSRRSPEKRRRPSSAVGRARGRHAGVPGARDRLRPRPRPRPRSPSGRAPILGAYRAFRDLDATMVEINPLVVTKDGALVALDAKMTFDDNALFRRPQIAELRDKSPGGPARDPGRRPRPLLCRPRRRHRLHRQRRRARHGDHGHDQARRRRARQLPRHRRRRQRPSGSPKRVPRWCSRTRTSRRCLVNIFAGINRCDWVAQGRGRGHQGARASRCPLVVRLAGTNVEEGRRILDESGLSVISAETLGRAAQKAVAPRTTKAAA